MNPIPAVRIGLLLRQALCGERDLEVDILRRDGRQSQGHQCVEEVVTIVAIEGGGHRRAWAHRLEAYVKVVRKLFDDGELVKETDEDLVEQGDEAIVQAAPRPGGLKQYYLETFLGAGPQADIMDHLAQPADARAHRLHGSSVASSQLILRFE